MYYGLSHLEEDFYADHLHKAVFLAPCTRFAPVPEEYQEWYINTLFDFPNKGIHHMFGTTHAETIQAIYDNYGNDESIQATYDYPTAQGVSVQAQIHWMQAAFVQRFQEYSPTFLDGDRETELVPYETIDKVPIAMLVGADDAYCTAAQANETMEILGDIVSHYELIEDANHEYFMFKNDEEWLDKIIGQLEITDPASVVDTSNVDQGATATTTMAAVISAFVALLAY